VFVEMAVNDEFSDGVDSPENLLRSLLNLDSEPAVLFVDFFALQSGSAQKTILSGQDVQSSLASWYDVPQVRFALSFLLPPPSRRSLPAPHRAQLTLEAFAAQISARPALLQAMIRDPALAAPLFLGDLRHGTKIVHRFLGSMVVGYLQEERCRAERAGLEERRERRGEDVSEAWLGRDGLGKVPPVRLSSASLDDPLVEG